MPNGKRATNSTVPFGKILETSSTGTLCCKISLLEDPLVILVCACCIALWLVVLLYWLHWTSWRCVLPCTHLHDVQCSSEVNAYECYMEHSNDQYQSFIKNNNHINFIDVLLWWRRHCFATACF